jgi:outer membrane protein OmpA-like peptidoglycan-associated protein
MRIRSLWWVSMAVGFTPPLTAQQTRQEAPVPVVAGMSIVQAVAGDESRGDYEFVITVTSLTSDAIALRAVFDIDTAGQRRLFAIERVVSRSDLAAAELQILGFHTSDASTYPGTSSLGPSLATTQALRAGRQASYSVKNYANRQASSGTIARVEPNETPFPVLINGKRVVLSAIHASGILQHPAGDRPWDFYFLDHPIQPLLLKVAFGPAGTGASFVPEWSRQVIRIDYPNVTTELEDALDSECRVELPGIYFEFNSASLNPESEPALRQLAALLERRADWSVEIEGHTDHIGSDQHNQALSARRAAAVRDALVDRFGIGPDRLTTTGFGESRPRETNATPEGRARNRRVELVRPCSSSRDQA